MSVAYARNGLIGVLTPQANTTVEPEMHVLTPPGQAWINARLMSGKATIHDRLLDYFDSYGAALKQFANAPVAAAGFACTGASYLAGVPREDRLLAELTEAAGYPVHTAASAVVDALSVLEARRIGIVSPYDDALTEACKAYWAARGFEVAAVASQWRESSEFHPIYSLEAQAAQSGLKSLDEAGIDAVVMLGTGMPTLQAIRDRPMLGRAPVMSCMLCIAWRCSLSAAGEAPTREGLMDWVEAKHWGDRLAALYG